MRILVVEDQPDLLRNLARTLREEGYAVDTAADGTDGLDKAMDNNYDALVLDVMMPKMDGWEVLKRLRGSKKTPVLMLTARDAVPDRIRGLDNGADDYLTKPFGIEELLARVRALLRRGRAEGSPPPRFVAGEVDLDLAAHRVRRDGRDVHLTRTEWSLLEAMAEHPGKLLTHRWLLEQVWGRGYQEDVEVLRVFISQLRRKIEPDPGLPTLIVTDPGVGYRWDAEAVPES